MRQCGDCQLCCTLVPVRDIDKPAGKRCKHQRFGKGCAIYGRHPIDCQLWSCVWLTEPEQLRDMRRPDRAGYCIDPCADFIVMRHTITGEEFRPEVVQIWCDPKRPHAHRDPALRDYLEARNLFGLVRYDSKRGVLIVPPSRNEAGEWAEVEHGLSGPEHSAADVVAVLGRAM